MLIASVASLGAIAYTVARAGQSHGATRGLLIALALAVVSLSWVTVHTLYLLRYGDLYYGDPIGGIDMDDEEPPDYHDFAYLALTIGMTFQVSDTSLTVEDDAPSGDPARAALVPVRGGDCVRSRSTRWRRCSRRPAKVVPRGCQVGDCGLKWGAVDHAAR